MWPVRTTRLTVLFHQQENQFCWSSFSKNFSRAAFANIYRQTFTIYLYAGIYWKKYYLHCIMICDWERNQVRDEIRWEQIPGLSIAPLIREKFFCKEVKRAARDIAIHPRVIARVPFANVSSCHFSWIRAPRPQFRNLFRERFFDEYRTHTHTHVPRKQ